MTTATVLPLFTRHDRSPSFLRRQNLSDPTCDQGMKGRNRPRASSLPQTCSIPVGGLAYGVAVANETAFVSCINSVAMINLLDKRTCARVPLRGMARGIACTSNGKSVYVACHQGGLNTLSSIGDSMNLVEQYDVLAVGVAICKLKPIAVVACEERGLCFFDTRTHSWLSMLSLNPFPVTLRARAVAIKDDRFAYIACDSGFLVVVDFSDPRHPVVHASKKLYHGDANAIALSEDGETAYVACGTKGIHVIDLTQFKALGQVKTAYGAIFDLKVTGSLLLCACQIGGLAVFSLTPKLTLLGQTNSFDGICHGVSGVSWNNQRVDVLVTCQSGGVQLVSLDEIDKWPSPKKAGLGDACSIM